MTQKVWQHGSWAKVGDLVRYLGATGVSRHAREHALVTAIDTKKFAGPLVNTTQWGWIKACYVEVYKPDFDYDREMGKEDEVE